MPTRVDSYALTAVGYMGNNVLPARAGDAIRMVLMAPRAQTSMRTVLGTLLAERLLDVAVLVVIFVVVGYGLLGEVGGDTVEIILLAAGGVLIAGLLAYRFVRRNDRLVEFLKPIVSSTLGLRRAHHGLLLLGHDAADLGDRGRRLDGRRRHDRLRHGPDRGAVHRRAGLRVLADPVRPRLRRHAGRARRSWASRRSAAPARRRSPTS